MYLNIVTNPERGDMDRLFAGSPDRVAERLIGKIIKVGRKQGTILEALPQDHHDNANWIDSRPLFGRDPVDAYVAPYRSALLLFLRTGAENSCVRIDRISQSGEIFPNPTQVCEALGIEEERCGEVSRNGQVIKIRWY